MVTCFGQPLGPLFVWQFCLCGNFYLVAINYCCWYFLFGNVADSAISTSPFFSWEVAGEVASQCTNFASKVFKYRVVGYCCKELLQKDAARGAYLVPAALCMLTCTFSATVW